MTVKDLLKSEIKFNSNYWNHIVTPLHKNCVLNLFINIHENTIRLYGKHNYRVYMYSEPCAKYDSTNMNYEELKNETHLEDKL